MSDYEMLKPLKDFKQEAEKLLPKIEKTRGTVVLPLLYSMNRLIAKPDVDEVYDILLEIGEQPRIDVILFSRGGDPDQAYIIGNMLQEFATERLTIVVPRFAKSAATIIACAGDELVMGPASELGPIDLIVEKTIENKRYYISVLSVMELIRMIREGIFGDATPKVLELIDKQLAFTEFGDYGRLMEHTIDLASRLLKRRMFKDNPDMAVKVAEELCKGWKSHNAAIIGPDLEDKLRLISPDSEEWREPWKLIWRLHRLWVNTVIEFESIQPPGIPLEALNIRVGKGIVFCVKPEI